MNNDKYLQMRSQFLQLKIGYDQKPVWVKQLKQILNNDIHQKPLGCKISNTHIKVGNVHIESFYEAEVLFSHHYWVNCFSKWLEKQITSAIVDATEVLIIGYETFIEPVLFLLQDDLNSDPDSKVKVFYGIYEEPKYTQNLGYSKSEKNIKFLDSLDENNLVSKNTPIVFLCGISTTLNTYRQMYDKLCDKRPDLKDNKILRYSLIQVMPDEIRTKDELSDFADFSLEETDNYSEFVTSDTSERDAHFSSDSTYTRKNVRGFHGENHTLKKVFEIENTQLFDFSLFCDSDYVYSEKRNNNGELDSVLVKYLVSSESKWHPAHECSLCNLSHDNASIEYPIIQTSETSVVPSQMIKSPWYKHASFPKVMKKIDMFEKSKTKNSNTGDKHYLFQDFLYYGHIDRMDHHFIYYVRSAHMIKSILDDMYPGMREKFIDICEDIKTAINISDPNVIDVIVSTSESGDEVFPCAINRFVFLNRAHTLSIDPNKEFRSNFCTKFSNFGYLIDQIKKWKGEELPTIRFHYVSKHLIATETFNRVKSLIESLMQKHNLSNDNPKSKKILESMEIFSSVIVFLSRNSLSSKYNYVSDINRYFSFVDIDIPSIRYYGDACPMCKLSQDVIEYKNACVLQTNAKYWEKKEESYCAKSTEVAKKRFVKECQDVKTNNQNSNLNARYFRRFYFENELYKSTKGSYSLQEYNNAMLNVLNRIDTCSIESVISFVKVISSPFLYYQENEKKAALGIILDIAKQYLNSDAKLEYIIIKNINANKNLSEIRATFNNDTERYALLVICLNCLSKIDSTFLLSVENIKKLTTNVGNLNIEEKEIEGDTTLQFEEISIKDDHPLPGFLSCIANNCKRILCGISGDAKKYHFEKELREEISDNTLGSKKPIDRLTRVLFFENTTPIEIDKQEYPEDVFDKYKIIITDIANKITSSINNELNANANEKKVHITVQLTLLYYTNAKKDVSFQKGKNNDKRIVPFSEDFWNNNNKVSTNKLIVSCMENAEGYYIDTDSCVVFISSEKDNSVFLHISLKDYSQKAKTKLIAIRECLRYSNSLTSIIQPDLDNNLIQLAFQADDANQLISTGKIISHNGFQDANELSVIANYLITQWYSESDRERKEKLFINSCRCIHSFMNRCIGFGSITRYIQTYGASKNEGLDPKLFFVNSCLPVGIDNRCYGPAPALVLSKNFLLEFLMNIFCKDSPYWEMIAKDSEDKYANSIKVEINKVDFAIKYKDKLELEQNYKEINKIVLLPILSVNLVPKFLNTASFEEQYTWIFLIGIIDTLLRNIPEHSGSKFDVTIRFNSSKDNYYFEIENKLTDYNREKIARGQTKGFFDFIDDLYSPQSVGFKVDMDPDTDKDFYTAKIIIMLQNKEEEQ